MENQGKENTRLARVKSFSIPGITLGLLLIFVLVPALRPAWGGLFAFNSLSPTLQGRFYALVGGGGVGLILCAEIVGRVEITYRGLDMHKITFTAALRQRNLVALLILYPITLFMEEALFRGLLLFGCLQIFSQELAILASAGIFGLYHVHIFLSSQDVELTALFVIVSFFLGLLLGPLFLYFGIWVCFFFHLMVVSIIYLRWNRIALTQEKKAKKI